MKDNGSLRRLRKYQTKRAYASIGKDLLVMGYDQVGQAE